MKKPVRTYVIEELCTYELKAKSAEAAERIFLSHISVGKAQIECEVHEREVYEKPDELTQAETLNSAFSELLNAQ